MKRVSQKGLKSLNSRIGINQFLHYQNSTTIAKVLRNVNFEENLRKLQVELIHMQSWVEANDEKLVVLFEGRDAAGKGGAIRRITEHLNPRKFKVVALPRPTEVERGQWYFQRYISKLPRKGKIVFFDRSWYNRAVVEPVNDFCTRDEYNIFMNQVNEFERMITESGIRLIKFYFSISKKEQAKRFDDIISSPVKKWKYSAVDQKAIELWDSYTEFKTKMFAVTDTEIAPWIVIKANRKSKARLEAIQNILNLVPYKQKKKPDFDSVI